MIHKFKSEIYRACPLIGLEKFHQYRHERSLAQWLSDDAILLHVPKNAGSSFSRACARPSGGHFTFKQISQVIDDAEDRTYFAVYRDPVDRLMSIFKYAKYLEREFGGSSLSSIASFACLDDFVLSRIDKDYVSRHYFLRRFTNFVDSVPGGRLTVFSLDRLQDHDGAHEICMELSKLRGHSVSIPRINQTSKDHDDLVYMSGLAISIVEQVYSSDYEFGGALGERAFRVF